MKKVTEVFKFTKRKKYARALIIIGSVTFILLCAVIFLPNVFLMPIIPVIAAGLTALVFLSLYFFVFARKYETSLASFTKPIVLSWLMPVFLCFFTLLLLLPSASSSQDDAIAVLLSVLIMSALFFILPVGAIVLSILGMIYAFKHFRAASSTENRIISEAPILLSIIGLCVTFGVIIFALYALI